MATRSKGRDHPAIVKLTDVWTDYEEVWHEFYLQLDYSTSKLRMIEIQRKAFMSYIEHGTHHDFASEADVSLQRCRQLTRFFSLFLQAHRDQLAKFKDQRGI